MRACFEGTAHQLRQLPSDTRTGRLNLAADFFETALRLSQSHGPTPDDRTRQESGLGLYRQGEFNALIGLGHVHRQLGRFPQAIACYEQVLRLACAIGNRNYQFEALEGMGYIHLDTGDFSQAVSDLEGALELARDLNQHSDEVRALHGLALAHRSLGRHDRARDHWQQTLDILTRLGITEIEELTMNDVRANLAALGDRTSREVDIAGPADKEVVR